MCCYFWLPVHYFRVVQIQALFPMSLPYFCSQKYRVVINDKKRRAVAYWLLAGVFMIIIQVLLGGITRLTGSGLSITEWKPIMGSQQPCPQAVKPFPEKNELEITELKMTVEVFILGYLFIAVKCFIPFPVIQWWQRAHYGFPFGDG